jgi:hypothetical protein
VSMGCEFLDGELERHACTSLVTGRIMWVPRSASKREPLPFLRCLGRETDEQVREVTVSKHRGEGNGKWVGFSHVWGIAVRSGISINSFSRRPTIEVILEI